MPGDSRLALIEDPSTHASPQSEPCGDELPERSSKRLARPDLADPEVADWYIDKLIGLVHSGAPIGPGACYLATNLRRHLDARLEALRTVPRLEPALDGARERLAQASFVAERLEAALGQLIAVSGVYRVLAARELTRHLEHLREHLRAAHGIELDVAMRAAWEDLGGCG